MHWCLSTRAIIKSHATLLVATKESHVQHQQNHGACCPHLTPRAGLDILQHCGPSCPTAAGIGNTAAADNDALPGIVCPCCATSPYQHDVGPEAVHGQLSLTSAGQTRIQVNKVLLHTQGKKGSRNCQFWLATLCCNVRGLISCPLPGTHPASLHGVCIERLQAPPCTNGMISSWWFC